MIDEKRLDVTQTISTLPNQTRRPQMIQGRNRSIQLYRAAQSHYKNGAWKAALTAVEALLKNYPKVQELHQLRTDLLDRIREQESRSYKRNPIYRAAVRHLRNGELVPGQVLVARLVNSYPLDADLRDLQKELYDRIKKDKDQRKYRWLLMAFAALLLLFVSISGLFLNYVRNPEPFAGLIMPNTLQYAPHYLFSIYGVDKPVGISLSPQEDRLYVTEMGGSRMIRIFDRKGASIGMIEPPHTSIGERAPVYLATDNAGQLFVSDRKQHAVYIFNSEGDYLDTLVGPDLTLSEYVARHTAGKLSGDKFVFNLFQNTLFYQDEQGAEQTVPLPLIPDWSPLGIRIDHHNTLFLTDVEKEKNTVHVLPIPAADAGESNALTSQTSTVFGSTGEGEGEFLFPNAAMADSRGRIYIADGNNGRISVWSQSGGYLFSFGKGSGEGALSLPRGLFIDDHDRLFAVDAVGQNIKVYDVSKDSPVFLYAFGDFGIEDGMFNFPNDITVDSSGRVYIADRENNRIQVWSY